MRQRKKEVSLGILVFVHFLFVLFVILSFFKSSPIRSVFDLGVRMGESVVYISSGIIAILCARKCSKWASEIKASMNAAYLIGFFFGLFGLLGYWMYYKKKK